MPGEEGVVAAAAAPAPLEKAGRRSEGGQGGVRAGEWDDNANYREFLSYIGGQQDIARVRVERRRFLVVRDAKGKAVPNCKLTVSDSRQRQALLTTTAAGRAILFPHAEGLAGEKLEAIADCEGAQARANVPVNDNDGVTELRLPVVRSLAGQRTVDVAFVLDTTGSMSEEISAVKSTIRQVSERLAGQNLSVRIGLVEYKDRGDPVVTRAYAMTGNLESFERQVANLSADGGGDLPEDMNQGLALALKDLSWSPSSVARVAFVIADAPPHLDYEGDVSYAASMRDASRRGIKLYTIAASGMDDQGQAIFRQLAQYTGGTNLFVLRGGAGPQSTGGGDPKSSCGGTHQNYTSGNLDALIVAKISAELASVDADPMRIAGLGQDENAKPCSDRLVLAR
jgi:Mg-chelatase subunit ChlD